MEERQGKQACVWDRGNQAELIHFVRNLLWRQLTHSCENGMNPLVRVEPSWPSCLLKVPSLNIVVLTTKFQHEFWRWCVNYSNDCVVSATSVLIPSFNRCLHLPGSQDTILFSFFGGTEDWTQGLVFVGKNSTSWAIPPVLRKALLTENIETNHWKNWVCLF